jgi:hypothetical protein
MGTMEAKREYVTAKAEEWGLGEAGTGTEQVAVRFKTEDGRGFVWYGSLTDAALPTTVKALRVLGWKGNDLSTLGALDTKSVQLTLEEEEYQGRRITRVAWVNDLGIPMKKRLEGADAKQLGAKYRQKIAALESASADVPY